MGAGHASTSIGYAVGIKEAMRRGDGRGRARRRGDRRRRDDRRRGVRGDPPGRRPGHAARGRAQRQRDVDRAQRRRAVALLQPRRLEPGLWKAREGVEEGTHQACPAGIGAEFERLGPQLKESIKAFWAPGLFWEELDWAYMGVIDGHDVRALRRALRGVRGRAAPSSSTARRSRARASRPPRRAAWRAWRSGMPPSPTRSRSACRRRRSPAAGKPAAPQYTQVFGEALVGECERDLARGRHHGGDELGHRAEHPPEGDARPLLRRRHRRAAGAAVRRRPRAPGLRPVAGDLLHLPAARVRPDRPRRLPPAAAGRCWRWTAPAWSATTGRRTTARSTSPTCAACPTSR